MATNLVQVFFDELAEKDPQTVCQAAQCSYDAQNKCYRLSLWGDEVQVYPREQRIHYLGGKPHSYTDVLVIHYLLVSKAIEPSNEWVSEKDIPGGPAFFRGPHEIPAQLIVDRFGDNVGEFRKRCEQLGGKPLDMADAAYAFTITPRIPVAVLYWQGDEDFGAESKLLFDRSIGDHLALDVIYALAVYVCTRIANAT